MWLGMALKFEPALAEASPSHRTSAKPVKSFTLESNFMQQWQFEHLISYAQEKLPSKTGRTGLPSERTNGDNDGLSRPRTWTDIRCSAWKSFYIMNNIYPTSECGASLSEYIGYQQWISRMSVQFRGWIVAAELNDKRHLLCHGRSTWNKRLRKVRIIEFLMAWCWICHCMTVIRMWLSIEQPLATE